MDSSCNTPICTCANGYSGIRCESIVGSVCQVNSCVNGNCVMLTNSTYQCQCTSGFIGTQCNLGMLRARNWRKSNSLFCFLVNSCLSNPCHQGTCISSTNCVGILCGYTCLCPNGTSGTNCEIGANACASSPCQNGGSCNVVSTSYVCQCPAPFGGSTCGLTINVCTPNPCLNGGVCVRSTNVSDGTYQCQCSNGYIGGKCEYCKLVKIEFD